MDLKQIYSQFPRVYRMSACGDVGNFTIVGSPFENCQTFSILRAYRLSGLTNQQIILFFKLLYGRLGKLQCVIDIENCKYDSVVRILKVVSKKIHTKRYVSTNNSRMVILIVQIDLDKLY